MRKKDGEGQPVHGKEYHRPIDLTAEQIIEQRRYLCKPRHRWSEGTIARAFTLFHPEREPAYRPRGDRG